MLIDDHVAYKRADLHKIRTQSWEEFRGYFGDQLESLQARGEGAVRKMEECQRFVLSPHVVEAAFDLSRSQAAINRSRDFFFTPAVNTWIEWSGDTLGHPNSHRHGVFLAGVGEGQTPFFYGVGFYVCDKDAMRRGHEAVEFYYDFPGDGPIFKPVVEGVEIDPARRLRLNASTAEEHRRVGTDRIGRFIAAALALINTPHVTQVIEHDHSRLNTARLKKGNPPLLSYKDVTIKPDSGWVSRSDARNATGEKRRHHVRTFMRLRRGKVELVSAHWRGNREKGYVLHRHVVRMTDEEAGRWKGEPLPGPRIMKPDDDVPE